MKLIKKIVAASSFMTGSILLTFSVSNLEFQDYTDSPLIDWKILALASAIAFIPFLIIMVRRELRWRGSL